MTMTIHRHAIQLSNGTFYTGAVEPATTRDVFCALWDTRPAHTAKLARCADMPFFHGAKVVDVYAMLDNLPAPRID